VINEDVTPSTEPKNYQHLKSWFGKGFFAVLDQGLFSGTNFIVNILLARWLEPAQYGAFAVAYSVFLLLAAFHTAVLTEPMLVFGAGKYAEKFQKYLGIVIYGHWGVTGTIALLLALVALAFWQLGSNDLAGALAGLAVASPFILLLWVVRRALYVKVQPQQAATGGILYLLLILVGMYGLDQKGWLSSASALVVMGISSLFVSIAFLTFLQPQWRLGSSNPMPKMILYDHWRYGRWAASSELLRSLYGSIYYIMAATILSLGSVAALRAIQNIVNPIHQFFTALALLLVPRSAKRFMEGGGGSRGLTKDAVKISIVFTLPALAYWVLIVIAGPVIVSALYVAKYDQYTMLIPYVALAAVFAALGGGPHVVLRAARKPDLVFVVYLFSACFSILTSWFFITFMGLLGAAIGISCSVLVGTTVAWWLWLKKGFKGQYLMTANVRRTDTGDEQAD